MSKIKKIILAVLSVICLISSVGLIACNNNGGELKLDTRVPQVKYYTGYNVDMFDLFVQEGGYTYAFSVTKTGETEAESTSRFYFVSEAGEYKAACTASKGEQSITKEVTFDVYDAIPYMVMAKNSVVVDWMKRDSLANIFAYSQARILTENAYEEVKRFIRACVEEKIKTVTTVVSNVPGYPVNVERCEVVAKSLGAKFRAREYIVNGY